MKCWFERLSPTGDPIELPEGKSSLVFGRSSKCTLVFDDLLVSPRHVEVSGDGTFWRVRDLGTEAGTKVNGRPVRYPRALFDGDRLQFGRSELRFRSDGRPDDPLLQSAITKNPDADEPWLVYADWLLEQGDPLGERMAAARSGGRLDHASWLGPLGERLLQGELEVDWHLGFARRATFRLVVGQLPYDWHDAVSTLLRTRIAQFLRELVIDVPRLRAPSGHPSHDELIDAQRLIASLPTLPTTLEHLSLGYHIGAQPHQEKAIHELAERLPRLAGQDIFVAAQQAQLRVVSMTAGARLIGVSGGIRALTAVTRVRRSSPTQVHLESPPGIPFIADGNPCHFAPQDGTWRLFAGRLRGELRVNDHTTSVFCLLPGDMIRIQGAGTFRFEIT